MAEHPNLSQEQKDKILKNLKGGDAGAKPARGHYEQYRATVRSPVPVHAEDALTLLAMKDKH